MRKALFISSLLVSILYWSYWFFQMILIQNGAVSLTITGVFYVITTVLTYITLLNFGKALKLHEGILIGVNIATLILLIFII